MSLNVVSSFNGVTDPDAGAYIAAVEAADGQLLEFAVGKAINDFVVGCKVDGIWNAIKASCILAGARTLNGALVPLVGTAPTNNNFVSGDYNRKTGLVGNGSTKYLSTNYNYNQLPQNNAHISAYATTFNRLNNSVMIAGYEYGGVAVDGANRISLHLQSLSYDSSVTAAGNAAGLYGVSRSSSTSVSRRYFSTSDSVASPSTTPVNAQIAVFVYQATLFGYSSSRLAFYSIGESLDLAKLDSRVTALITAFGAAIP